MKRAHDTLTPSRYGFTNTLYLWLVSAKPISSEATATWRHHWEKKKNRLADTKVGGLLFAIVAWHPCFVHQIRVESQYMPPGSNETECKRAQHTQH